MDKLRPIKNTRKGEAMTRCFSPIQIPVAAGAFADAEKLVTRHFRLNDDDLRKTRYDVKTLAFLQDHEVKDGAFAHLCQYSYQTPSDLAPNGTQEVHFYRVCLQDNAILDAVDRANSFIKLSPLMLYIAVHELIHVLRFENGHVHFNAGREEKEAEERIVHGLTRAALEPVSHQHLDIVLDCFSTQFAIGDLSI